MKNTSEEKEGEFSNSSEKGIGVTNTSTKKGDITNTSTKKGGIPSTSKLAGFSTNKGDSPNTSELKGGISNTSEPKGDISNTSELKGDISNTSGLKGDISSTSELKGGVSNISKLEGDFTNTSIKKGGVSGTPEGAGNITNTEERESVISNTSEDCSDNSLFVSNSEPQLPTMGELRVGVDAPKLNDYESYEQFREVVEMWDLTSDHAPKKRGSLLALALPNKSKQFGDSIQTSLFKKIKPAVLAQAENGVTQILEFLDDLLGQDDFTKEINAFEKMWLLRKKVGQSIQEYVKEFELRINECKINNCEFTDKCTAFVLLLAAGLTHTQYELIKGTVDLSEKGKVFQNVKNKMLTMLTNSIGNVVVGNPKPEQFDEAFYAEHEQAFLAWSKKKNNYKGKSWGNNYNNNSTASYQKQSSDTNPRDKEGRIYKCRICDSYKHLAKQCPHNFKNKNPSQFSNYKGKGQMYMAQEENDEKDKGNVTEPESDEEEREKVYFTTNEKEMSKFTAEALNSAALDTCCTKSLAGQKWIDIFLKSVPEHLVKDVKGPFTSKTTFEFGNQSLMKAGKAYKIPVIIGEDYHQIEIDIIDSDIPLLLSKDHMKQMGIALDMGNDTATINGKQLEVNTTSAGHFIVSLFGGNDDIDDKQVMEEVMAVQLIDGDDERKLKLLTKIHRQFAHRPKDVFVNLLKTAGQWDSSFSPLIDKIINGCEGCILRKRNMDRPAVAMAMANDFNQVLSLDLKIRGDKIILYMIDVFTRYTLGTTIRSKSPEHVVKALIRTWIRYFGLMDGLMFDNGGEFSSEWMREVCSRLDIKNHTTGAYSPWQNGINEKNHAHADGMLDALLRDYPDMDIETGLAWICSAKNSLTNVYGFSPHQLVFGRNPKLPNILDSPPPAREVKAQSEALLEMLNVMHKSREKFMEAESCEKLKRALNCKMRTAERLYKRNEWVYYKRDKDNMWMGPAKVIFQDGKVIMVRHGGYYCRVSANRIHPVHDDLAIKLDEEDGDANSDDEENTEIEKTEATKENSEEKDQDKALKITTEEEIFTLANEEITEGAAEDNEEEFVDAQEDRLVDNDDDDEIERVDAEPVKRGRPPKKNKKIVVKPLFSPPERIEIKFDGKWEPATVLQRGSKAGGKFPTWYNFQLDNGQVFNDDAHNWEYRKITGEDDATNWAHEEVLAVLVPKEKRDSEECMQAKLKELDKLKEFATYDIVDDEGQGHVTTTWVLTEKGTEIRARLTARGFMEDDEVPKDSPTMHKSSLRIVLALAAANGWKIETSDIKSAFLQGNQLEREVFVKPPRETGLTNKLWRLNKCLYGLRDASKQWYCKVRNILEKNGFKKSRYDSGLFYITDDHNNLVGIVGLHVDDFIHCGTEYFNKEILPKILKEFTVGKSESQKFMYTGFMINQDKEGITLDQSDYVDGIEIPTIDAKRMMQTTEEMTAEELTMLRKMTGQLNWTVRASRPDLSFNMIALSTKFKGGLVSDLKDAKKTLVNLKQHKAIVKISAIKNMKEAEILLFTDASYGNINDGKDSTGGYIIFLIDPRTGACAPLDWRSNKTKRRANSTLAAEALSLSTGLDAAVGIRWQLLDMLGERFKLPITCVIDNKDTYDSVHSSTDVSERRLRREIAILQEYLETEELRRILWCRGEHQLADCLTKKGVNPMPLMQVLQSGYVGDNILNIIS